MFKKSYNVEKATKKNKKETESTGKIKSKA